MLRVVEDLVQRTLLDDLPGVHHERVIGDLGHDAEVVRDQHHGQSAILVETFDQGQDLRLDRHVERRARLVGDQDLGLQRQRQCDHRALAHAARELVRVVAGPLLRLGNANRSQSLDRTFTRDPLRDLLVGADLLDDLLADPVNGVERRHRVLEDHRDLARAHLSKLIVGQGQQIAPVVADAALDRNVATPRQPHHGQRRDALAAARLAYNSEDLAGPQIERHAVDRLDLAALGRKRHAQIAHAQQRLAHAFNLTRGSSQA